MPVICDHSQEFTILQSNENFSRRWKIFVCRICQFVIKILK